MKRLTAGLAAACFMAYPLVMFFGLRTIEPRYLALLLVLLLVLRMYVGGLFFGQAGTANPATSRQNSGFRIILLAGGALVVVLAAYAFISNRPQALTLYPVIISFSLLFVFAASLVFPPPIIERLARLSEPELSTAGVRYTRKITQLWCGFFLLNGLIALYTSLYANLAIWTLYNGLIAYLLIGLLVGGEVLYRRHFLKQA